MGLMDFDQIKVCVEKSRTANKPDSSLMTVTVESGFLNPTQVNQLNAILSNGEVRCQSCQSSSRAGDFKSLKDFQCKKCKGTMVPADTQTLFYGDSPPLATVLEANSDFPEVVYPSEIIADSDTRVGMATPSPGLGDTNLSIFPSNSTGFADGAILNNQLEIKKMLGKGGMGAVYLAYDRSLERDVAVKVISGAVESSPDVIKRFEREAQTAAQINHPNIVQVYGMGVVEGQNYILFEFVDGCSLKDLITKEGPLPSEKALDIIGQIAQGLKLAHQKMILHRDIKPDNIFITRDGIAKMGDFGLAKDTNASMLTQSGTVMGTPHYMSPEQAQAGELDGRSDIYSLGATLYHAVLGKTPFAGPDPMSVLYKQINEPLAFPREFKDSVPPAIRQLLKKMMAKEKWRRPKDMEELLELMEETRKALKGEGPGLASSQRIPSSPASSSEGAPATMIGSPGRRAKSPLLPLGIGVAVLLLASLGILWYMASQEVPQVAHPGKKKGSGSADKKPLAKKEDPDGQPAQRIYADWQEQSKIDNFVRAKKFDEALKFIAECMEKYPKDSSLKDKIKEVWKFQIEDLKDSNKFKEALVLLKVYLQMDPENKTLQGLQKKIRGLKFDWELSHKYDASKVVTPLGVKSGFPEEEKRRIENLIRQKAYRSAMNLVSYYAKKNPHNQWLQEKRRRLEEELRKSIPVSRPTQQNPGDNRPQNPPPFHQPPSHQPPPQRR